MSGKALQCENCGTIIQDPSAESCPRCRTPLGQQTLRVAAQSWENIDGGWDDLETDVQSFDAPLEPPPARQPARTLVGMGIMPTEGLDSPSTDPEGIVGMTQPMPSLQDDPPTPPPERLSGPVAVAVPGGDSSGLPTMPIERVPSSPNLEPLPPGIAQAVRGRGGGAGLPTLPPEGLPGLGKGLPTLDIPQPDSALSEAPDHELGLEPTERAEQLPLAPGEVDSSFAVAAFDDMSMRSDYDADASSVERPSEAKTLPPSVSPELQLDDPPRQEAPTLRRGAPPMSSLPRAPAVEPANAAFADKTFDGPASSLEPRQGVGVGLIALWIVAIAAVVAAALVVVLR